MSNVTSTFRGTAVLDPPTSPKIYNVAVALANTEVSQALTASTKFFLIRARGRSKIKLAFVSGESGTKYITVSPGCVYTQDGVSFTGTLYFQTSLASETIEVLEWT